MKAESTVRLPRHWRINSLSQPRPPLLGLGLLGLGQSNGQRAARVVGRDFALVNILGQAEGALEGACRVAGKRKSSGSAHNDGAQAMLIGRTYDAARHCLTITAFHAMELAAFFLLCE